MNLQQLRFVQEAARRGLNLTETAKALHTSQPGVSKAIIELEEELGIDIFTRHGKRLKRITEPGHQVLAAIEIVLREISNMRRIGEEYAKQDMGTLSIATTHAQARYFLPSPVAAFRQRYPKVGISLHQGSPAQVVQMLLEETADIGIATEALSQHPDLLCLPCYEWQHAVVFPAAHPLARLPQLTLHALADWPIVTYHPTFTGRTRIDAAFAQQALSPAVVLEAIDADVIKTYVRLGLGIGIVGEMAVHDDAQFGPQGDLQWRAAGHLFGQNITRVAFKRHTYLKQYVVAFAELLSTQLTHAFIHERMNSARSS